MKVILTTLNAKYIHKNLALRYLYTTKPDDIEVEVIEYTIKEGINKIALELVNKQADIIGISTYIWNVEAIKDLCRLIKDQASHTKIILGGPEVSFEPEHFLNNYMIDAISCGEGEFTFWQYVKAATLTDFDIDGIYTKTIKPTKPYAYSDLTQIEKYPNPYFLDFDKFDQQNRYLYLETSRGCPYKCAYCLSSVLGNVRLFSIDYIKGILDDVFASDIKQIKFLDRTFNVDRKRALEIAQYISENAKKDQVFQFEIMAEHLSNELIEYIVERPKLPRFRFEIGIQSTNMEALKAINRVQDFIKLKTVIEKLKVNHNCEMHVDLIAGLPMENLASFKKSFNDVFMLEADELQLGFLKILRGTNLKAMAAHYELVYEQTAPYSVATTKWLNSDEMKIIKATCLALDTLYNKPRAKNTIDYLIKHFRLSPFALFEQIGQSLIANKALQLDQLFAQIYAALNEHYDKHLLKGLLSLDYYQMFKQKTKRFIKFEMDKDLQKQALLLLQSNAVANMNDLINYGFFADGYMEADGYLFILYNRLQTLPAIYFISKDITNLIKLKGETVCED